MTNLKHSIYLNPNLQNLSIIGGHHEYHELLQQKIAGFFGCPLDSSLIYTTGYTANSSSLLTMLKTEDVAITDMAVHASVYEGLRDTNTFTFSHNYMDRLERLLKDARNKYRTRMVIIDGVYSQDGDLAVMDQIYALTKQFGGYLMVDDAHGIGVLGENGRGVIEIYNLLDKVDVIIGTLSKASGYIGGFIISKPHVINF